MEKKTNPENQKLIAWPPSIQTIKKLRMHKAREETGLYLLEGASAVRDALRLDARIFGIVYDQRISERENDQHVLAHAESASVPILQLREKELRSLSGLNTPPPIVALVWREDLNSLTFPLSPGLILALDRVSDPGNAGTLLRAAAFYAVPSVLIGAGSVELYNPKVIRAAMACHLHLNVFSNLRLDETLKQARDSGALILAATVDRGIPPETVAEEIGLTSFVEGGENSIKPDSSAHAMILLLGNEPHGIDPGLLEIATHRVAIPRRGKVDSLNVAMAGTVLLDRLTRPCTRRIDEY